MDRPSGRRHAGFDRYADWRLDDVELEVLANVRVRGFLVAFAALTVTLYRPSSGRRIPRRPASGIPMSPPAPPDARACN